MHRELRNCQSKTVSKQTKIHTSILKGVYWPSLNSMWGRWAPPVERSLLMTISSIGSLFGIMFSQPVSGVICSSDHFGGWPSAFYVFGWLVYVYFFINF